MWLYFVTCLDTKHITWHSMVPLFLNDQAKSALPSTPLPSNPSWSTDKGPWLDVHGARELHTPLDGRPQREVQWPDKLEVVASFYYLGDMLSAAVGCEPSTTTRDKTAWKKFKELLPVLSSHHLSFKTWRRVQLLCTALVCTAQCSMPVRFGLWQSQTSNLCSGMKGNDLDLILKERKLCWYGHVEHSNAAVKTACDIQFDGMHGPGWPKMTWMQLQRGIAESGSSRLSNHMIDKPGDLVWDLPCMQQASYLEGGHWCGCCPCTCILIKIWWWWCIITQGSFLGNLVGSGSVV